MGVWKESVDRVRDLWDAVARRSSPIQESWNKGDFPGGFPQQWENDTADTVLGIASAFACVRIIAGSIATVPLDLVQDTGDRKKKKIIDEPEAWLFSDGPNDETTVCELIETTVASLLLNGNGFHWTPRDAKGRPREVMNLEDHRCNVRRDTSGQVVYDVARVDQVPVPYHLYQGYDMWHVKRYSFGDGLRGNSIIRAHAHTFATARSQQVYTKSLYDNKMTVGAVIETKDDRPMDKKEINALEKRIAEKYKSAKNAGRPLILPGLNFKNIAMTPEDAQMIENFNYTEKEISKIFGVPLHMISNLDRATFSNIEQQQIEFVQNTLRSWCKFIEASLRQHFLNSQQRNRGWRYSFDLDELAGGIMKDRFAAWQIGIQGGFLTPNEAREWEGLDAKEGLDEPLSPLNMLAAKDRMAGKGEKEDGAEDKKEDAQEPPPKSEPKPKNKVLSKAERALVELVSDAAARSGRKAHGVYRREGAKFDEARAVKQAENEIAHATFMALRGLTPKYDPSTVGRFTKAMAQFCVVRAQTFGDEPDDLTVFGDAFTSEIESRLMTTFDIGETGND